MSTAFAILGFVGMATLGVFLCGGITHFVLATVFGLSVTFGQSIGIGMVLGLIWSVLGGGR